MSAVLAHDQQAAGEPQSLSVVLARHLSTVHFERLPSASIEAAKKFMLDTLAVGWAGSNAPGCAEARAVLLEEGGRGAGTVWAYGDRLPATSAAFLNSMFGAALDFDSLGRDAPSHVNVVVLPAALALAEREHASGQRLLAALVAGADLMSRLGAACEALDEPHRGWFYTSVHGVFGAAAAASVILQLNAKKTQHALGIAFSQAAGTQQANIEPSLTKRMQSGFAARAGVFAALLAARGITAPREVFEGACGLFKLYQPAQRERLLDGLGARFENVGFSIKKFPSCGCNHTAIEGALRLTREYDLVPDDVSAMEVVISPFMNKLVGGEFDPGADPQVAAQFNIRYSIACALTRRKFGLAELENDAVFDPAIARLIERTSVRVDPLNTSKRGPMTLAIASRRHGTLTTTIEHVPGSDEAPMSEAEINEKSLECFALGANPLDSRRAGALIDRVLMIEELPDVAALFCGLTAEEGAR